MSKSKEEKKSLKEKLSGTVAEVNKKGEAGFEKLAAELNNDISEIAVEFHEKLMELEAVEAEKKNAKIRYQRELDAGNEEGMSLCLSEIRGRNVRAEELRAELAKFPEEVQKLYARQTKIFGIARAGQVAAADKVREGEKLLKEEEGRVKRCYGLQGSINTVNTDIQELIRVHKKEKKTLEDEVKAPRGVDANGFWLEVDDPFAEGTLRHLKRLKQDDNLVLPCMLNFKDRETAPIDDSRLKASFEKSKALQTKFGDLKSYLDFKGKIIVQVLEMYIVRANGGGDTLRGFAGQAALGKCR